MEKRIEYQGMTSQPSDYVCPDGDMMLAVNAEYRDGGWKAVREPQEPQYRFENFKPFITHEYNGEESVIGIAKKETELQTYLDGIPFGYFYDNGVCQAITIICDNGYLYTYPFLKAENGSSSKSIKLDSEKINDYKISFDAVGGKITTTISCGDKENKIESNNSVGIECYRRNDDREIYLRIYYNGASLPENKSEAWLLNFENNIVCFRNLKLHGEESKYNMIPYRTIKTDKGNLKFGFEKEDGTTILVVGDGVKIRVRKSESIVLRGSKISIINKRDADDFHEVYINTSGEQLFEICQDGSVLYQGQELGLAYKKESYGSFCGDIVFRRGEPCYHIAYYIDGEESVISNIECKSYDSVSSPCILGKSVVFYIDGIRCVLTKSYKQYSFFRLDNIELHLGFIAHRDDLELSREGKENVSWYQDTSQKYSIKVTMNGPYCVSSPTADVSDSTDIVFGEIERWKNICKKRGYFLFPVLVTYSIRLYDGSHINESTKILMFPMADMFCITTDEKNNGSATIDYAWYDHIYLNLNPYAIQFGLYTKNDEECASEFISKWKGLVEGVDIYVSRQIDLTSKMPKLNELCIGEKSTYLTEALTDIQNETDFYHAKFIPLSELSNIAQFRYPETLENFNGDFLFEKYTEIKYGADKSGFNLNFFTGRTFSSSVTKSFNNRLLLGNIKMKPCKPSPLWIACPPVSNYIKENTGKKLHEELGMDSLYKKINAKNILESYIVFYDNDKIPIRSDFDLEEGFLRYFPKYYTYKEPYGGIIRINESRDDGSTYSWNYTVKKSNLNDSYYSVWDKGGSLTISETGIREIEKANVIASTIINNIITIDYESLSETPSSYVVDIAIPSFEVSTGQFGAFNVFAFCNNAVFALSFSVDGKIQACTPYSYLSCNKNSEVLGVSKELVFCRDKKIYRFSTDGEKNSIIFDSDARQSIYDNDGQKKFISAIVENIFSDDSFNVLKNPRFSYDPQHDRFIVYGLGHNYYLILSEGKVSVRQNMEFCDHLRSVGKCYMTTRSTDNNTDIFLVYDYSSDEVVDIQHSYFITRPFKLDMPDVHKSIQSIIQRGVFCDRKDVQQALYGSNDLYNWIPVWSSKDIYLRGMRGSGYKYYKLAIFIPKFKQDEILHGCSVEFTPRLTNKPR